NVREERVRRLNIRRRNVDATQREAIRVAMSSNEDERIILVLTSRCCPRNTTRTVEVFVLHSEPPVRLDRIQAEADCAAGEDKQDNNAFRKTGQHVRLSKMCWGREIKNENSR